MELSENLVLAGERLVNLNVDVAIVEIVGKQSGDGSLPK